MKPGSGKKVVLAMSGGVDSSVAAALLIEQGYSVVGCFMRLGSEDSVESPLAGLDVLPEHNEAGACATAGNSCKTSCSTTSSNPQQQKQPKAHHQGCCSVNDAADARLVAAMLDIPFYVLNFKKDFGRVIDYFVAEYNAGRTPNPCVRCNDWLKFGRLWDYARSIDADFVASGHYARIDRTDASSPKLLRGVDHSKDQSYVLFGSPRSQLAHTLLPIGGLEKTEVRQIAASWNLPVFDKPDSQEICFVPDNDYARLVAKRSPEKVQPGDVLNEQGQVIGTHPGQQHFTIGQRRGLGVAVGLPLYVTARDAAANTITVGSKESLLSVGLVALECNWLVAQPAAGSPVPCQVKIRYNGSAIAASVVVVGDDAVRVMFDSPQPAVTPGQAAVWYDGDTVLGGGWIDRAIVV
jgi:tRNA-uridine 2-sulfurtransferase